MSWSIGGLLRALRHSHRHRRTRDPHSEPEPFDSLPAASPGMLPDGDAPFLPTSGIFVDDPGHVDDLAARVTAVYQRVREEPPEPSELRRTLAKDFFPAHIRMYSRSRRKAPIYWQLATPSTSERIRSGFISMPSTRTRSSASRTTMWRRNWSMSGASWRACCAEGRPFADHAAQSHTIEGSDGSFVEELSALLDEVTRVALSVGPRP